MGMTDEELDRYERTPRVPGADPAEFKRYAAGWERSRLEYRASGTPLDDPAAEALRLAINVAEPMYIDILDNEDYAELASRIIAALDGWKLVRID